MNWRDSHQNLTQLFEMLPEYLETHRAPPRAREKIVKRFAATEYFGALRFFKTVTKAKGTKLKVYLHPVNGSLELTITQKPTVEEA